MANDLQKFLRLVPAANWRGNTPQVWNVQLRQSLSDGLVAVGFGGVLILTNAGRDMIHSEQQRETGEQT